MEERRGRTRGTHELVRLSERRFLNFETIEADPTQRLIVEHDDRVGMVRQSFESEETVVRLYDNVSVGRIGKDGVGLNELLGITIVETFEEVGT